MTINQGHYLSGEIIPAADFDSVTHLQNKKFFDGEKKIYESILEHLRAGQLYKIQEQLNTAGCFDHMLMLNSSNPIFDNIEFKEEMKNTEDLFLQDYERQK